MTIEEAERRGSGQEEGAAWQRRLVSLVHVLVQIGPVHLEMIFHSFPSKHFVQSGWSDVS